MKGLFASALSGVALISGYPELGPEWLSRASFPGDILGVKRIKIGLIFEFSKYAQVHDIVTCCHTIDPNPVEEVLIWNIIISQTSLIIDQDTPPGS